MARTAAPTAPRTPEQVAQDVLAEHAIKATWSHNGEQIAALIAEAIRIDRERLGAHIADERVLTVSGYEYNGHGIRGARRAGAATGTITTTGRTNAAERQEVADRMATATETAEVTRETGAGVYATYRVRFITTHRIIPVRHFGFDAE